MIFGLAIISVMMAAGSAVDYGRASAAKVQLQKAVDATALALAKDAPNATDGELKRRGKELAKALLLKSAKGVSADTITVSREARTIRVTASGAMKTAFMAVAGLDTLAISSEAEAAWGITNIELALVLDNTGSMNETPQGKRKIDELKSAAGRLLLDLRAVAYERETVKVSIVPFDTEVRLDTRHRNADWLRWNNPSERQDWTGYVEDRDQPWAAPIRLRATCSRSTGPAASAVMPAATARAAISPRSCRSPPSTRAAATTPWRGSSAACARAATPRQHQCRPRR
ncbi:MAG TPA: Tad domain-containing protein, partial [Beijerinckiaceae bacterium]|nr:Tad domain-containing protein [Beijerinckiaceae bacterium]